MKAKYTKKQIMESIKHWKKVLESMDNNTIHDDQVSEDTKLVLEVPGTDGANIEVKGDWDAVRFCVDLMTDAISHMKAKDPLQYKNVSLHVIGHLDEARQFDLIDKKSATNAIKKHIDSGDINAFASQKPKPTKDQLIEFVSNIFKEEGLDTPWTHQFLIKMKMYTKDFDDALQYLFNAYLKGHNLGMERGLHMRESEMSVQTGEDDVKSLLDKVGELYDISAKILEGREANIAAKILKKCYTDLVHSLLPGSDDTLYEASYEEGELYRQSLKDTAMYLVPVVYKTLNAHKASGTLDQIDAEYVDLLNAACALAYYVKNNCKDDSLCEMANKIVQLGAGYMI